MKKILLTLIVLFFASSINPLQAGGPLVVKGGMAVSYGTRPFLYRFDKGPLGKLTNSEIVSIVESLYSSWQAVKTSEIKFQQDDPKFLDRDITGMNFDSILNSQQLLGYTPIVFDNDGTILNALYGEGASKQILGLAGPITVDSGPLVNEIPESQAIFNGIFVNGIDTPSDPEKSVDSLKGTIIHETGHGIGLDHSQINVEAIRPGATQEIKDSVPLEFPVAVNDLFEIRRDDASAISLLYPNESELSKFGKIEGKVFRQDGAMPALGANVIARNVNDPKLEAISCVSDYLADNTGSYTLFAVPPGDYTIEIEPIDLSFTEGSGVGPYTKSKTDLSFQNPVPAGFYTGANEPITTDPNQAFKVHVVASQTIRNTNIIAAATIIPTTSSSGSTSINEIEPNDSAAGAQAISPPVTISGNASTSDVGKITLLTESGNELKLTDVFKFTVPEDSSVVAHLIIESDLTSDDIDLVLLDEEANNVIDKSSQTGNGDELISTSVKAGTYLLGLGAFSGSAPYTLSVEVTSNSSSVPVLNITGMDTLIVRQIFKNAVTLKATGFNFPSSSKCMVTSSDNGSTVKIKPKSFLLDGIRNKKKIRVAVPHNVALNLISNNSSEDVTIGVTCNNGASSQFELHVTTSLNNLLPSEGRTKLKIKRD